MAKFLSKKRIILLVILVLAILLGWIESTNPASFLQIQREMLHSRAAFVVDGDTFELDTKERVRLIGIDTPEKGDVFYEEAKAKLAELIDNKEIRLEKDVSEKDRYGRLLRYVYSNEVFVNLEMVRQGYAKVSTFPPDVQYAVDFRSAEREARESRRGLWGI